MSDEPKIIELIRAGDSQKAFGLLVSRSANLWDKSRDGETAYDLAQRIGDDQMKMLFRTHLVCG